MYDQDSFFTLSQTGQIGLLMLSTTLALLTFVTLVLLTRKRRSLVRLMIALGLFAGFVWLTPQVYYQYYRIIIDGLPAQWVIGAPPTARHLFELLTFSSKADLSHHSQGALGWALVTLSILRRRPRLA